MRLIDADLLKEELAKRMPHFAQRIKATPCFEAIRNAPTVDAEPVRRGEWVKMRGMMPPEYMGLKECSVCGWHIDPMGRYAFEKQESELHYCPHCGAKMDGERREEE